MGLGLWFIEGGGMTSEVDNLAQRVARLERQNRQLKVLGAAIVLSIVTFFLIGAAKTPRTIEAEKIVIFDQHGHARITIGTPAFAGAAIGMNSDAPMIWLTDDKGADRAMLSSDGLCFASGKSRPTVRLDSRSDGLSRLEFYGTSGKVSWTAP
jgi:hypothetical protein